MAGTVESALQVNILKISKVVRQTHSNVVKLEWVGDGFVQIGIAVLLADHRLIVVASGQILQTAIGWREFRKDRFQPHIQCRACGKPRHVLYVDGENLQCRRCAGLIYASQRGCGKERAFLKLQKVVARLNGQPGDPAPPRPSGMWRRTYRRLLCDLLQAQRGYYAAMRPKRKAR